MANIYCEQALPPDRLTTAGRITREVLPKLELMVESLFANAAHPTGDFIDELERAADQEQVDLAVGRYIIDKYRTGAAERGYAAVAAQLKKQGIPFEVACLILNVRSEL